MASRAATAEWYNSQLLVLHNDAVLQGQESRRTRMGGGKVGALTHCESLRKQPQVLSVFVQYTRLALPWANIVVVVALMVRPFLRRSTIARLLTTVPSSPFHLASQAQGNPSAGPCDPRPRNPPSPPSSL